MTRPQRLRTPSPNRVTWLPQRGSQCAPPRRPRAASPRAVGDETSPAHYRRGQGAERGRGRGRGGGWELVPGLTCSPGGGWRRRGRGEGASTRGEWRGARFPALPQPCKPPEQRRRTDGARSSSCPQPRRRGDVSVHTYTHSGGRDAPSGAQLSPCFRRPGEKAVGGNPAPAVLGEGARTRKRDGENFLGFCF